MQTGDAAPVAASLWAVSGRRLLLFFGLLAVGLLALVLITGGRGEACAYLGFVGTPQPTAEAAFRSFLVDAGGDRRDWKKVSVSNDSVEFRPTKGRTKPDAGSISVGRQRDGQWEVEGGCARAG
jgi:hypothetical protein